jgi:hypothetical protein
MPRATPKRMTASQLKRDNARLRAGFQVEISAFRNSAELVLNELIRELSRANFYEIAVASVIREVAYGQRSAYEAKQWVDTKLDKIWEFKGTEVEFLEWLEIKDAEKVYHSIEEDIASKTNDYAVKMFMLERNHLKENENG